MFSISTFLVYFSNETNLRQSCYSNTHKYMKPTKETSWIIPFFVSFLQLWVHFTRYIRRSNVDKIKIIAHLSESLITGDETNRYEIIFQLNEFRSACRSIRQLNNVTHSNKVMPILWQQHLAKIFKLCSKNYNQNIFFVCVFLCLLPIVLNWIMSVLPTVPLNLCLICLGITDRIFV